jgi:hypothetical protein
MKTLLALLLISACATQPTVKESLTLNKSWPNADWQAYAYQKVDGMPLIMEFCPKGLTRANWVHMLAAVAKHESNFNPSLTYPEKFKNGKGETVISTGLFQVSYESAGGYGYRGLDTNDLKSPLLNIDIAIAIMKKWALRDGTLGNDRAPWRGAARYFSVFRYKKASMKKYMEPFCQ